jgi:propionate CoA-transferase
MWRTHPPLMRSPTRISSANEAIAAIPSGVTIAVGGFVGAGHPEMLTAALERCFLETGTPRDLTLYYCAGQGDRGERGLNHLAHRGLLKRIVGGHWNLAPKLGALALANEVEAYNLPQGVLSVLTREIAAKRPGLITQVGLNTFIDPIHSGGMLNARTTEPLVERLELDGQMWLRYKPVPIHVALIRATYADFRGNLSMEGEGLIGEVLSLAQAAKNNGGLVIAQVESIVDVLPDPKAVRVPGILVDHLVTSGGVMHDQTFGEVFNEEFVVTNASGFELPVMPESDRKRIGARALQEIRPGDIVNLGIGLPEAVAMVAAETGRLSEFTLTVESGPIGGVPASGLSFGCSHFPEAIIDQPAQFDFYDGGGLDIAVLGAVEIDPEGSVNVASFGDRFAGVGGFVNIAHSARRLVFCCTFRAKENAKFVKRIQHVCFHGPSALARDQQVLYVTERAVFELTPGGLKLIDVAPEFDVQRDVLDQMEFTPIVVIPPPP